MIVSPNSVSAPVIAPSVNPQTEQAARDNKVREPIVPTVELARTNAELSLARRLSSRESLDETLEELRDGREGVLVPASDPDALAAAIDRLARDPALRARLGEAAYRRLHAEFGMTAGLDILEARLQDALGGPGLTRAA